MLAVVVASGCGGDSLEQEGPGAGGAHGGAAGQSVAGRGGGATGGVAGAAGGLGGRGGAGGSAAGGKGTGGASTGGLATGGPATGGFATGGLATGGKPTANGGSALGGGGASGTGGQAVGGATMVGGGTMMGMGGAGGSTKPAAERRLPLPCTAPLPTGFCMVSDAGDYIGGGRNYTASGTAAVSLGSSLGRSSQYVNFNLNDPSGTGASWTAEFVAGAGTVLSPGLFDNAQRYPFQSGSAPGLDISGNGRGCNMLTGKFSVEEMEQRPEGLSRISVTFEQHCEGGTAALRGVINFQASGIPDRTLAPERTITFNGKIFRVIYDPASHLGYGLDATNRRLSKIDLASGVITYTDVVQVPNDACLDAKRGRLFAVNKGSSLITEYGIGDLKAVRDITWEGGDWGASETHFKIVCGPDKLYVVDGAWAPALFTVEGLDGPTPVVTDRSAQATGVGGLALTAAGKDLYTWYQYGWSAGSLNTYVTRFQTSDLLTIDQSSKSIPSFTRDPLDAPVLIDETRGLVFVKNKVFDALNLAKVIYTLPSTFDQLGGAAENAYALDAAHGHLATKSYVYDLGRYDVISATVVPAADQAFFDASGSLWFLSIAKGALFSQSFAP